MRNPDEQQTAFDCLALALRYGDMGAVERAEQYLAFVTGTDADDAKAKLAVVRQAVADEETEEPAWRDATRVWAGKIGAAHE